MTFEFSVEPLDGGAPLKSSNEKAISPPRKRLGLAIVDFARDCEEGEWANW